jgi:hypothetical protein
MPKIAYNLDLLELLLFSDKGFELDIFSEFFFDLSSERGFDTSFLVEGLLISFSFLVELTLEPLSRPNADVSLALLDDTAFAPLSSPNPVDDFSPLEMLKPCFSFPLSKENFFFFSHNLEFISEFFN